MTKIEVSPLPLTPGRSFNIKVTASDVTAGSATVDFRPLSPTILRVTLTLNGGFWTGSASVPSNLPVNAPTKAVVQAIMTKGTARALLTANVAVEKIEPTIKITSPVNLATLNKLQVTVQGTATALDPVISVNGVIAPFSNGAFSATVGLHEGNNSITAVLTDLSGKVVTASVPVTVDTEPPRVAVDSPAEGAILNTPAVTVTGTINDTVVGTVNGNEATVVVNALSAQIANRTFIAPNVPLAIGPNVLTVIGTDRVGNKGTNKVNVTYKIETAAHIEMVSGNGQSARISEVLANPLVVKAVDDNGNPASGKNVIFKVTQNDGAVISGGSTGPSLIVPTGADGRAQVQFKLGTRAGAGNNQVSATIVGFAGEITFQASATPSTPGLLTMDAGNNQVGAVGKPLPNPLATIVVDSGNNRLVGIPITFTVKEGGGSFAGQSTAVVNSDSDGRALAVLTLGPDAGNDNNRVEATFAGNTGAPAGFVASGRVPGKTEDTTVSGIVLDNSDVPVPGATLRILGQANAAQSDEKGFFQIKPAPVGAIRLICDGATVTRPGKWVWLQFDLVTIAGQDNGIGGPIRLLPINMASAILVDETHGGTITLPEAPGYSLTVKPNSATYPDGTKSGLVSVTLVHPDKMPDPPSFGQQPRFLVSIQPANTLFNPPAAMCIPNLDGHPPGQKVEMYSYDHDLGRFVSIGTGTISEDGLTLCSDPGSGVVKGGWHCGGNPSASGGGTPVTVTITTPGPIVKAFDPAALPSVQITASGSPSPAGSPPYEWTSSDSSIAKITSGANAATVTVQGQKAGKATMTVVYRCQSGQPSAPQTIDVTFVGVELTVKVPTLNLLADNEYKATLTPATPAATDYKFEIRRSTVATWFTKGSGAAAVFNDKPTVAGKFKLRVTAKVQGIDVVSKEVDMEVQFPDVTDILAGTGVTTRMDTAWTATKAATTATTRREEGYYITLDTSNGNWGITAHSLGNTVGNADGAGWDTATSPRPPDSIANPTPIEKPTYTVAWFHTHTPTVNRAVGRPIGPSGADFGWSANASINCPGYAYDYTESPAGSGNIPAGHPLNSAAQIYNITPPTRRPTP